MSKMLTGETENQESQKMMNDENDAWILPCSLYPVHAYKYVHQYLEGHHSAGRGVVLYILYIIHNHTQF